MQVHGVSRLRLGKGFKPAITQPRNHPAFGFIYPNTLQLEAKAMAGGKKCMSKLAAVGYLTQAGPYSVTAKTDPYGFDVAEFSFMQGNVKIIREHPMMPGQQGLLYLQLPEEGNRWQAIGPKYIQTSAPAPLKELIGDFTRITQQLKKAPCHLNNTKSGAGLKLANAWRRLTQPQRIFSVAFKSLRGSLHQAKD